jgi:CBS domain-containing protein
MARSDDVTMTGSEEDAILLPVRTRRVVTPQGVRTSPPTVRCPRKEASIAADLCFACRRFTGVTSAEGRAAVRCHAGATTEPITDDPLGGASTPAEAIMSRDVTCVSPDLPVGMLAHLLEDTGYSGAPVVDDDDVLVGMVSQSDLLAGASRAARTVRDLMMPIAFSMNEHAPVGAVAAMMAYEGVHRVPVVDDDGRVVGLVSALDVVRWVALITGHTGTTGP